MLACWLLAQGVLVGYVCCVLGAGLLAASARGLVGYVCSGLSAGLLAVWTRGLVVCVRTGLGAGLLAACTRGLVGYVCSGLGAGLLAVCARGMEGDVFGGLFYICETDLNRHVSSGLVLACWLLMQGTGRRCTEEWITTCLHSWGLQPIPCLKKANFKCKIWPNKAHRVFLSTVFCIFRYFFAFSAFFQFFSFWCHNSLASPDGWSPWGSLMF